MSNVFEQIVLKINDDSNALEQKINVDNNCIFEQLYADRKVNSLLFVSVNKNLSQLEVGANGQILSINDNKPRWINNNGGGNSGGNVDNTKIYSDENNDEFKIINNQTLDLVARIILFNLTKNDNIEININNGVETNGLVKHLFFDKTGTGNLKLKFNSLMCGSGEANQLLFNSAGQSATIVYIGNKWRLINTGAIVSSAE